MVQQAGSNLEKSRRMTGSTPNLSQAQLTDRYQTGFDTTPTERAQQLKKAREQIEQDKIKRTESLKQRISMFEAARQKSNAPPERTTEAPASLSGASVGRSQSLKMAPTFQRSTSDISALEQPSTPKNRDQNRHKEISESLADRRSMVAGILSAGPPKKKS